LDDINLRSLQEHLGLCDSAGYQRYIVSVSSFSMLGEDVRQAQAVGIMVASEVKDDLVPLGRLQEYWPVEPGRLEVFAVPLPHKAAHDWKSYVSHLEGEGFRPVYPSEFMRFIIDCREDIAGYVKEVVCLGSYWHPRSLLHWQKEGKSGYGSLSFIEVSKITELLNQPHALAVHI